MNREICYISPISIHSYRWIEAFRRKGYRISVITDLRTWIAPRPRNIPIYYLPTLDRANLHCRLIPNFVSIRKILKKDKPDLVHLHVQHHYAPAVYFSHFPYLLHSWGLEVLGLHHTSSFRRILAKQAAAKARKIIVDANCMKQIWNGMGIPENKVEVIPFGVDTDLFNPTMNGASIREKLDIRKNDITIISTRPFFKHYNIECLVKAAAIVTKRHENVKFIIKGRGPLERNIRTLAEKLRVFQHLRFTDPVPYREMPQHLAAANIYVSPSFIDSTSVSLLEAMACGLPPITTDIPGNREWITNEVNGLLYPPKDHRALAEKITQLVENRNSRRQFGRRSRQIVLEKATWKQCVAKMEAIYQSIQRTA